MTGVHCANFCNEGINRRWNFSRTWPNFSGGLTKLSGSWTKSWWAWPGWHNLYKAAKDKPQVVPAWAWLNFSGVWPKFSGGWSKFSGGWSKFSGGWSKLFRRLTISREIPLARVRRAQGAAVRGTRWSSDSSSQSSWEALNVLLVISLFIVFRTSSLSHFSLVMLFRPLTVCFQRFQVKINIASGWKAANKWFHPSAKFFQSSCAQDKTEVLRRAVLLRGTNVLITEVGALLFISIQMICH